jgi:hypothetical protein
MYSIYWIVFTVLRDCGVWVVENKVLYIHYMNLSLHNPQSIMQMKLVLQISEKNMCTSHKNKYKSSKSKNNPQLSVTE